ncbi:MAG: GNAT family N-acetyltransferase [Actinomycetota bacterium]
MHSYEVASTTIRDALPQDASHLAILADAATRRLVSWLWDEGASPGQSSLEVGRTLILDHTDSPTHLSNWVVAEQAGLIVGALNSGVLDAPPPPSKRSAEVLRPLNALKDLVVGSWYVAVASTHPEFRGQGVGRMLLAHGERSAAAEGCDSITLMVGSFNEDARRLYERIGFAEQARRPFHPFPGSDDPGEWILMAKPL